MFRQLPDKERRTYMPISEYHKNEFDQHESEIRSIFNDNGLFGARGNVKGTYFGSLVVNTGADPIIIPMYAGTATDRTISERLREHAVNFYNDSFKFTGVRPEELKSGKISYNFDLRAKTADYDQAKKAESLLIMQKKTYLQYSCYPKFYRSDYTHHNLDVCVMYQFRRPALLMALLDAGIRTDETDDLTHALYRLLDEDQDWREPLADKTLIQANILTEMELRKYRLGSPEIKLLKDIADRRLNIPDNSRGCTYPYLIEHLSNTITNTKML